MSLLLILGALNVWCQWPKTTEGGDLSKTRTPENTKQVFERAEFSDLKS